MKLFTPSKYVDDNSTGSLLCCEACTRDFVKGTYKARFGTAEDRKFLDAKKSHTRTTKDTQKPKLVLTPVLKNEDHITGKKKGGVNTNGVAPWWEPYSVRIIAGILWGFVLRWRQVLPRARDRHRYTGKLTAGFVLRGYEIRRLRNAWARTPWSPERQIMLRRLSLLAQRKLPTQGWDLLAPPDEKRWAQVAERLGKKAWCLRGSRRSRAWRGKEAHPTKPSPEGFGISSLQPPSHSPADTSMASQGSGGRKAGGQPNQNPGQQKPYWNAHDQKWHQPGAPGMGRRRVKDRGGGSYGGGNGGFQGYGGYSGGYQHPPPPPSGGTHHYGGQAPTVIERIIERPTSYGGAGAPPPGSGHVTPNGSNGLGGVNVTELAQALAAQQAEKEKADKERAAQEKAKAKAKKRRKKERRREKKKAALDSSSVQSSTEDGAEPDTSSSGGNSDLGDSPPKKKANDAKVRLKKKEREKKRKALKKEEKKKGRERQLEESREKERQALAAEEARKKEMNDQRAREERAQFENMMETAARTLESVNDVMVALRPTPQNDPNQSVLSMAASSNGQGTSGIGGGPGPLPTLTGNGTAAGGASTTGGTTSSAGAGSGSGGGAAAGAGTSTAGTSSGTATAAGTTTAGPGTSARGGTGPGAAAAAPAAPAASANPTEAQKMKKLKDDLKSVLANNAAIYQRIEPLNTWARSVTP